MRIWNANFLLLFFFLAACQKPQVGSDADSPIDMAQQSADVQGNQKEEQFKNQKDLKDRVAGKLTFNNTGMLNAGSGTEVVVFLDPEDPYSARTYRTLRNLTQGTASVRLILRFKTSNALGRLKARMIYAAEAQSKAFEVADVIFSQTLNLKTQAEVLTKLREISIDTNALILATNVSAAETRLQADETFLQSIGMSLAPAIFAAGVRLYDFEVITVEKAKDVIRRATVVI